MAAELLQWFTDHGGQLSDDVDISFSDARGFYMRAVRPLASPVIVTCPFQLTLSRLNLDPEQKEVMQVDSCLRPCQGNIPDHILTYLLLIEQRNKRRNSPWHAYIACLPGPESMKTPLWFDDQDMAFLAGTSLAPAVQERKNDYYQHLELAVSLLRDLGLALADQVDFESLLWAATIFTSRAFISTHILPGHETVPILFPVLDILNHSATAKVEWDFNPRASFSLKLLDGDTFAPGQELFNNYAPKQNDELLLGYGFCLENNPIEQFPLKLAFPPMMQDHAKAMGLFDPSNVPFGMSADFLTKDPDTEQHFLRAKGHPFGRYENIVPFFRGIPPYIVHFFFIQTLLSLSLDVGSISHQKPGGRITLQVLTLLHQAITQRSQTLPILSPQQPQNEKQKYAKMYRDGQARIIHTIRDELQSALDRLRPTKGPLPITQPCLYTCKETLAALFSDSSNGEIQRFEAGCTKHNLHNPDNDCLAWTLLLVCLVTYSFKLDPSTHTLLNKWLHTFYLHHPLPSLEDGIEDPSTYTFVYDNLPDFLLHDDTTDALVYLDNVGDALRQHANDADTPVLAQAKTHNLGARVIMWAMSVAEQDVVSVLDQGVAKKCLLLQPCGAEYNDRWMYEEGG
ncbi:hypothetical protein BDU57DRAFT_552410 [Ampelomyces quisqualis]|uniref:SET domain-containing protein n=1 Tax=Ampelomyces quisqualis TaxID=50730 RepID=A0A6A5Q903_AMPQU|nr:hypothetical protein BDU57DRAFT_552410 [Ampelomyces quisqualis]